MFQVWLWISDNCIQLPVIKTKLWWCLYLKKLTSPWRNTQEPEGQQHPDIQQHHKYEGHSAQDVVVREEDEGLHETEAGSQVVLQSKVLLPHWRPARRVLKTHAQQQIAVIIQLK